MDAAPSPRTPREPVPSVPPIGEADGSPLRYGGLRAASIPAIRDFTRIIAFTPQRFATYEERFKLTSETPLL